MFLASRISKALRRTFSDFFLIWPLLGKREKRGNENSSLLPSQPLSESGDINSQPAPESGSEGLDTEELHTEELPNSVTPLELDTPSTPISKAPSAKPTPFIRTSYYGLRSGEK